MAVIPPVTHIREEVEELSRRHDSVEKEPHTRILPHMILDGQEKACVSRWRGMAIQHSEAIAPPLVTNDTQEASSVAQRYDPVIKNP
jgi:hypothetical protein